MYLCKSSKHYMVELAATPEVIWNSLRRLRWVYGVISDALCSVFGMVLAVYHDLININEIFVAFNTFGYWPDLLNSSSEPKFCYCINKIRFNRHKANRDYYHNYSNKKVLSHSLYCTPLYTPNLPCPLSKHEPQANQQHHEQLLLLKRQQLRYLECDG